jgi:hypothetical protein
VGFLDAAYLIAYCVELRSDGEGFLITSVVGAINVEGKDRDLSFRQLVDVFVVAFSVVG